MNPCYTYQLNKLHRRTNCLSYILFYNNLMKEGFLLMKLKYRFHPRKRSIENTENLYERMASNGWFLKKRGLLLSSFIPSTARKLNYQIALCTPKYYKENRIEMNEKLDTLRGWKYITHSHGCYVYSSEDIVSLDTFYHDENEKKEVQTKFKPKSPFFLLSLIVFIISNFMRVSIYRDNFVEQLRLLIYQYSLIFFLLPAIYIIILCYLLLRIFDTICIAHYFRPYKECLTKHKFDTDFQNISFFPRFYTITHRILIVLCFVLGFIIVIRLVQWKEYDLPNETTEPYLLFHDLGYQETMSYLPINNKINKVSRHSSYLCNYWDMLIHIKNPKGSHLIKQEVFRLRNAKHIDFLVRSLMETSTIVEDNSSYQAIEYEGLDTVYISTTGCKLIIVKDNDVYRISLLTPSNSDNSDFQTYVLSAIASN